MTTCQYCQAEFNVDPKEIEHLKNMSFTFGQEKITLPPIVICPDCRQQTRNAHRNEQYMYQRNSDFSGKKIISIFTPKAAWGEDYKVYSNEEWFSDNWDALRYGQDYNFNTSFFEQYKDLHKAVPKLALISEQNENCPYVTHCGYCKNCHLTNCTDNCENCYYGKLMQYSQNCIDCTSIHQSELCYGCINDEKCYQCIYLYYSSNCSNCYFSENLKGCKNCFLCTNLINQEYCFLNKQLSKKDYEEKIKPYLGSYQNFENLKKTLNKLSTQRIHKYANILNSENCTGDFLTNCQNCTNCYDLVDSQDCHNIRVGLKCKNCFDCNNTYIDMELCHEIMSALYVYHSAYSIYIFNSSNILYSECLYGCKNCFGCTGLRNKEYCVFNKQYTKKEYEELVPRIIKHMQSTGEWGLFFPIKYAPHCYNETVANDYYPLSKAEVLTKGWNWHEDTETAHYEGPDYTIPDHIKDVPKDIIQKILKCEKSGKLYKVIPQELKFYQQLQIPIPHLCPLERLKERATHKNPQKLYPRNCQNCQAAIQTTYAPDRPERVYCEKCYLEDVY